jgi:hypothetical protein
MAAPIEAGVDGYSTSDKSRCFSICIHFFVEVPIVVSILTRGLSGHQSANK